MDIFSVPQGKFSLQRYPDYKNDSLRAWDAADEYMLQHINDNKIIRSEERLLIMNDSWGALALALAEFRPQVLSDSLLSHKAIEENLRCNNKSSNCVALIQTLEPPQGSIGVLLFKVPKTLSLLEDQLCRIRKYLAPDVRVLGAGMTRDVHTSTLKICERILGKTSTSQAKKKARLIFCDIDESIENQQSPYPTCYRLGATDWLLVNHANVFSRVRLDNASRLLIAHIKASSKNGIIADLCCGNGVLGLTAGIRNPNAEILFFDESFMAVASTTENIKRIIPKQLTRVICADGLGETTSNSLDLIICNPPFHRNKSVDKKVPWRLFRQAYKALRTGGQLLIVGHISLRHDIKLRRIFGNCKQLQVRNKFCVLCSEK
jgi:23S rRNA (guanine1835-N2)-methyltransferase|tara:strand:- start:1344 stop:2471 length:1128 start_codon:yes stop_codon:yes gene_type:complete